MKYGQIVVGPAGSGKTNYCKLMKEFMVLKKRNCYVINLDSASEEYYYERKKNPFNTMRHLEEELKDFYYTIYDIDIRNYIRLQDVVADEMIGPNCGLLRSIELFNQNSDLLDEELSKYDGEENYFLIDTPGQIELYTHTDYFKRILEIFTEHNIRLVVVFLIDISFISSNTKLLAAYLTSLSTMVNFELPHVNILAKCDLLCSRNYYKEFKKFKNSKNYYFQRRLNKRLQKKIEEANEEHTLRIQDKREKSSPYINSFFKDHDREDVGMKSFAEEYLAFSDHEKSDESGYSSATNYSELTGSSNYSDSDLSDHDEDSIYQNNLVKLNELLALDPFDIVTKANKSMSSKYYRLNQAFANIIQDFNLVSFLPLNIYDDDNVDFIINTIDMVIHYGDEKDVKDTFDM